MYKTEAVRKAEVLETTPALAEFIDDIPTQKAVQAFSNLSFRPESHALNCQFDYATLLTQQKSLVLSRIESAQQNGAILVEDWEVNFSMWFDSFHARLRAAYMGYLSSLSGCASAMITGPVNFPVERMRKRNGIANDKYRQIKEYSQKAPERFLRRIMPFGDGTIIQSNAPNATELLNSKIARMEKTHAEMIGANKIVRKTYKGGSAEGVSPEAQQKCALALAEFLSIPLDKALNILQPSPYYSHGKVVPFYSYQLANHNAEIARLKQRLAEVNKLQNDSLFIEQTLTNGIEIKLSEDGKIEIHFGYKPDEQTRRMLCDNSFKFSRYRNNAWVRKFTPNAQAVFSRIVKPALEKLPQK
jgi:prefoldin subunit 5